MWIVGEKLVMDQRETSCPLAARIVTTFVFKVAWGEGELEWPIALEIV